MWIRDSLTPAFICLISIYWIHAIGIRLGAVSTQLKVCLKGFTQRHRQNRDMCKLLWEPGRKHQEGEEVVREASGKEWHRKSQRLSKHLPGR